jgi:hypothetical protein
VARAILQNALLHLLHSELPVGARVYDQDSRSYPSRLNQEALPFGRPEVAIEMGGAQTIESARREWESERIGLNHAGRGIHHVEALARDGQHARALIGSDDAAAQVPCQEAGAARHIQHAAERARAKS